MKTRRKKSQMPFADALAAANKRLVKAEKERIVAQHSLSALDAEIPALQATIAALENQLNPNSRPPLPDDFMPGAAKYYKNLTPILSQETIDTLQSKYYGPVLEDHPELAAVAELTEDELLPEPEGQPVTPED